MASDAHATWKHETTGKVVTGSWNYWWAGDYFVVQLDGNDDLGMRRQQFHVHNDGPEWGLWRLVRAKTNAD